MLYIIILYIVVICTVHDPILMCTSYEMVRVCVCSCTVKRQSRAGSKLCFMFHLPVV